MVRLDDSSSKSKCWIDFEKEVPLLEEHARERDWKQEIAIQLMSRVGCRASGVLTACPNGLRWNSEGEYWELQIRGKNTKGGDKTVRDTYVPESVKKNLDRYASERDIDDSEPYVDTSVSTVRRWVREVTDNIADNTGHDRWKEVSSHDLRRSWATHHLVEKDVAVRVMMEIGGWSSYDAIEPYLTKPTPAKIGEELRNV
ncbi:site-specific integrase [Halorubrum laminariae]|uniref:Tyrosine-type recombinase/integrase n=1 Tax=Halorubrum laminariae TaxID=1433523 RepID=A0ABD6BXX7_9EURY|nr:site-specific integrase [Halorubrum laminariae]